MYTVVGGVRSATARVEPRERNDTIRTGYARWVPKRKNKEKSAKGEKISPSDQSHQKLCGRALVFIRDEISN